MRPVNLDRELFNHLAATTGETSISIYLPTEVTGDAIDQNRIRMKNGIAHAETLLESAGWKPRDRDERFERARGSGSLKAAKLRVVPDRVEIDHR